MKIGIAQINTRPGDFETTSGRMVAQSERAAQEGVELLVFPLAALAGVEAAAPTDQGDFYLDMARTLEGLAQALACPCVVAFVCDLGEGTLAPMALLIEGGRVRPLGFGLALGPEGPGGTEDEGDAPAYDLPEVRIGDLSFGIAFGYEDLDDYDDYDFDVDAILYLSSYGYAADDPSSALGAALSENRFVGDALKTGAWIVGVGSLGGYGMQVFTGSSFVLDPTGALRASAPGFEESFVTCDIGGACQVGRVGTLTPEVYDRPFHLWQSLCVGLRDYLAKEQVKDVALVIDGTLRSLALAALATDALGPTHVHALVDVARPGVRVGAADGLVRSLRIDVLPTPPAGGLEVPSTGVATGHPQALRRGIVEAYLAAWAHDLGALVLSSLDKTTLALEGMPHHASAAALCPLGDVYLEDIVAMVRMRNTVSPILPPAILEQWELPVVAGYDRHGVSGEAWTMTIGLILSEHLEWGRTVGEIVQAGGQDPALVEATLAALDAAGPWRAGRMHCLSASTAPLVEACRPPALAWRDHVRGDGGQDGFDALARLLLAAGPEPRVSDGGELADEEGAGWDADERSATREISDALGFLRDFSLGGGFRPTGFGEPGGGPRTEGASRGDDGRGPDDASGREGPGAPWPSPFSQN